MNESSEIEKIYITPSALFEDSCRLAVSILESGFRPNYLLALWRGGTPVGITIQEILAYYGIMTDHIAIRSSHYVGIEKRADTIRIHGLGYFIDRVNVEDSLLIVDDIFDTGITIDTLIRVINKRARRNTPSQIRIAATWFKPKKNKTDRIPDYYANSTNDWVVFPHEIMGLTSDEIRNNKPYVANILTQLESNQNLIPNAQSTY